MQKVLNDDITILIATENKATKKIVADELWKAGARVKVVRNLNRIPDTINAITPTIIVIDYKFLRKENYINVKYACEKYPKICIVNHGLRGHITADFITSHDKIDTYDLAWIVSDILAKYQKKEKFTKRRPHKQCSATRIRPRMQRAVCAPPAQ